MPIQSKTRRVFLGREVDRRVAVDRRGADQLDIGRERRGHQRDGVIGAGVDVEDDLGGHIASLSHGAAACAASDRPLPSRHG
jgi:hypothetical protein